MKTFLKILALALLAGPIGCAVRRSPKAVVPMVVKPPQPESEPEHTWFQSCVKAAPRLPERCPDKYRFIGNRGITPLMTTSSDSAYEYACYWRCQEAFDDERDAEGKSFWQIRIGEWRLDSGMIRPINTENQGPAATGPGLAGLGRACAPADFFVDSIK